MSKSKLNEGDIVRLWVRYAKRKGQIQLHGNICLVSDINRNPGYVWLVCPLTGYEFWADRNCWRVVWTGE